jgi:hypothetical protein
MESVLLDTDTLSEIMKGVDPHVQDNARPYLAIFRHFTFSIITRYEILRGLKARRATRQMARFEQRCQHSQVLPCLLSPAQRLLAYHVACDGSISAYSLGKRISSYDQRAHAAANPRTERIIPGPQAGTRHVRVSRIHAPRTL